MAASTESSDVEVKGQAGRPVRVLCLGNELISDDGIGPVVARVLGERLASAATSATPEPPADPAVKSRTFELPGVGTIELAETALTGMYLLELVVGASRLIVVDSVVTGTSEPGTVMELREHDLDGPRGSSPHYIGLLETLDLARALGLDVADDIVIVAIEAGDFWTVGGPMTDRVRASVPSVVERTLDLIAGAPHGVAPAPVPVELPSPRL